MSLVLGIESSCDETSVALLDGAGRIRASVVSSQLAEHGPYGGVVPEIAARAHLANLAPLLERALEEARTPLADVTLVGATAGPGLVGALLVGLSEGKGLSLGLGIPFAAVHHVEAHCLSPFLRPGADARDVPARFHALVLSGGHSHLFRFAPEGIEVVARTRDDAAGEAYDKVAKLAGLGYPGGPILDRLARRGRPERPFAVPEFKDGALDFSFSGLKTAVRERLVEAGLSFGTATPGDRLRVDEVTAPRALADVAADFQEAVARQVERRLERARERDRIEFLTVSGGVAANSLLRERLAAWGAARGVEVLLADRSLTGDNAAMIAFAALVRLRAGREAGGLDAAPRSRWPLETLPAPVG